MVGTAADKSDQRGRLTATLVLDLLVVALECMAFSIITNWPGCLIFYTELSNLFAGIVFAASAAFLIRELRTGVPVPKSMLVWKHIATSCLAMTFAVVLFVLAPWMQANGMQGFYVMFIQPPRLFTHFLCPLVAFASQMIVSPEPRIPRGKVKVALIPTTIYAVFAIVGNVSRAFEGPYPFLRVYDQPKWASVLWVIGLFALGYGLSLFVWWARGIWGPKDPAEQG